jgi:hypothetical protein
MLRCRSLIFSAIFYYVAFANGRVRRVKAGYNSCRVNSLLYILSFPHANKHLGRHWWYLLAARVPLASRHYMLIPETPCGISDTLPIEIDRSIECTQRQY